MHDAHAAPLDPIKEVRLRTWARLNHVPPGRRADDWHPVVLEEMARRDEEQATAPGGLADTSRYVPLAPSTVLVAHAAHEDVPPPHVDTVGSMREPAIVEVDRAEVA